MAMTLGHLMLRILTDGIRSASLMSIFQWEFMICLPTRSLRKTTSATSLD